MVNFYGLDEKNENRETGQLMIEASASSGFPMAVAYCHYNGWNGLKRNCKKAFDLCVKIDKKTNGYHWAQYLLGRCYENGYGVDQDDKKRFEYMSLSSEQGNSAAMNSLGYCYDNGKGTDVNRNKAFEWYEKSANLGDCSAMYNVGFTFQYGFGVTKDSKKAKEFYTKAAAQGEPNSQTRLNNL